MLNRKLFQTGAALLLVFSITACEDMFIFDTISSPSSSNQDSTTEFTSDTSNPDTSSSSEEDPLAWMENVNNTLFIALYNYYGQDQQHFTYRWLGMLDALNEYGIEVEGHKAEKDARNFKIDMTNSKLPADAEIYMVNNQTWDPGLQFTRPLTKKKPIAVISTCNGVEFASAQIKANSPSTQNATMGGFSTQYQQAFEDGSLNYLISKYSCHIAPIFAAGVNAVRGNPLRTENNEALRLSIKQWEVKSLEDYYNFSSVDRITDDEIGPTIRKSNIDKFFEAGGEFNNAKALETWCSEELTFEAIQDLFEENKGMTEQVDTGRKVKVGILRPGSVNDSVAAYINYMKGYLGRIYNCEFVVDEDITSSNDQKKAAISLCNKGAELIISVQDDTNRNAAIIEANSRGVYFANAGTCQNPKDYAEVKDLPYFVGSIGTSIDEERRSTYEMTKYYLELMCQRGVKQ